jgi:hypothetical protein
LTNVVASLAGVCPRAVAVPVDASATVAITLAGKGSQTRTSAFGARLPAPTRGRNERRLWWNVSVTASAAVVADDALRK